MSSDLLAPSVGTGCAGATSTHQAKDAPLVLTAPCVPTVYTSGSILTASLPLSSFRTYSPSQTADFLACPVLRQFKRLWTPRVVEWSPAMLLGNAVQAGINVYLNKQRGPWEPTDDPDTLAEATVTGVLEDGYVEQSTHTVAGLVKLALRGVQALLDKGLFDRHEILMLDDGEFLGHSRPDVVSRHDTEGLGITDFKVSRSIDDRIRPKRMSEYTTDDQLWHYSWETQETLGEPVKWARVVQVILAPRSDVLVNRWDVDPDRLAFWLTGAEQHWRDMQAEDEGTRMVAPRWPNCRGGKYGVCDFYDACHVLGRDPDKMVVFYERKVQDDRDPV